MFVCAEGNATSAARFAHKVDVFCLALGKRAIAQTSARLVGVGIVIYHKVASGARVSSEFHVLLLLFCFFALFDDLPLFAVNGVI
jgi:hypothetical protein